MIRIALCDDDQAIREALISKIEAYAEMRPDLGLEPVCFGSAKALLSALEDDRPFDIFLLDVYIGDGMGTDLAKTIRKRGLDSPIIFLTTSVDHAPESFETGTLRYLMKPLNIVKFREAMHAAVLQIEKQQHRRIKLKTENGVESVNAAHILYSEAHDHYQYVTRNDGHQIKVRMTVAELLEVLKKHGGFIRVGNAYIINLRNVKNVTASEVCMFNNFSIPIPRGKSSVIKQAFWDYQCESEEV